MYDLLLHTGFEHPHAWWVAGPAVLAFVLGVVAGRYGSALLELLPGRLASPSE